MPAVTCPSPAELRHLVDGQSSEHTCWRSMSPAARPLEVLKKALLPRERAQRLHA